MSIRGFEEWLATPAGQYVLNWEKSQHDLRVADIFGFNAVQLSLPNHDFLAANRMPLRFRCDDGRYSQRSDSERLVSFERSEPAWNPPRGGRRGAGVEELADLDVAGRSFPPHQGHAGDAEVRSDLHYLPFAANSIDLVVLPHTLEFDDNPHQVLREVERVLVPEGQVIVTGFNPFSLWGAKRKLSRRQEVPPWRGQYISVPRLKDWFSLLGFEIQDGVFGCYAPAVTQEKWLRRFEFMDRAGDRWWPIAGAVYIVQAVKRQHGLRLITPKWQDRKAAAKALATVTQKLDQPE